MKIYKWGGLRSFYDGNLVNIIRVMPETALKFTFYEHFIY